MDKQCSIQYMVRVKCLTFNHAKYIEDALNGFCMQETDFPFVCTIIDDASTDGEQEVIKKYLQEHFDMADESVVRNEDTDDYILTFARHKTNTNCFFAVFFLKYNHYSIKKPKNPYINEWLDVKYIALCEGDDYWIDPLKLQKQVDFLEVNPDYSMCFHRAKIVKEGDLGTALSCEDIENREYSPNELLKNWKVPTASIVASKEYLHVKNKGKERILNGDIIIVLNCAKVGKIGGMSEVMSAYRVQQTGVTYDDCRQRGRCMKYPDHFRFIKDNYPFIECSMINYMIAHAYMDRSVIQNSFISRIKDIIAAYYYCPGYLKLAFLNLLNKLYK